MKYASDLPSIVICNYYQTNNIVKYTSKFKLKIIIIIQQQGLEVLTIEHLW